MSKEQKGFVVYGDIRAVVDELTDEQTGQLFRGMIRYFSEGKAPKFDGILKYVWIPIGQQMDRDRAKYDAKCEKNREKIQKYWDSVKKDTTEYNSKPMYTNATNTNTNTDTKTKKDTDTDTATKTNGGGGGECDDEFNIFKLLGADGIDAVYDAYPNSGGDLLQEVYENVKTRKKKVKSPVAFVLGYAKKAEWDDNADHFIPPWEA